MSKKAKYVSESSTKDAKRGGSRGKSPGRGKAEVPDTSNLTQDEINEIKEAFDLFDSDNSGTIDPKEINAALASLGQDKTPTIFRLLAGIEELGASITFEDFLGHISERLGHRNTRDGIKRIFDLFDADGSETINVKNLARVARELGESMTEEELQEALAKVSADKQAMTFDDFYVVMTKKIYG
ncbi:unnamed protein product [Blepharisma stoltei]|uniref:EF-hand domain-containing protein n=1 Tax=Blepharisma stoltei TaxID=1481888 RepID=A0AAU9K094_9CILI|nr:unnamed protein product [Blepharisma stoltei]